MAVLPGFVLGAGGVLVRADLGFGTGGLAAILAAFFTTAAGASALGGVLSDRLGARRVLVASAALSAASLLGVAFVARRWADLMVLLVLAGVANGLSQPAANLALARVGQSQGLTFGIKQSGIPMSTLIAGMLVPSVGLAFGWRAVFAGCAVVPVVVAVLAPPDGRRPTARPTGSGATRRPRSAS
jgi:MFS family permease